MTDALGNPAETAGWLAEHKAVRPDDIPQDKVCFLKQPEVLGLVSRSGFGAYVVQKERLRKLLKQNFAGCSDSEKKPCLSAYAPFLTHDTAGIK